jgi:hypothetical protein
VARRRGSLIKYLRNAGAANEIIGHGGDDPPPRAGALLRVGGSRSMHGAQKKIDPLVQVGKWWRIRSRSLGRRIRALGCEHSHQSLLGIFLCHFPILSTVVVV